MTHKEKLLETFQRHGGKATLGELIEEGRYTFAHKLTARISDLREVLKLTGFDIYCHKKKRPTDNLYEIVKLPERRFENGQGWLV